MARVASCPQCEHELLVPDDAEPSALVKCPQCRAFFELQHADSRELPAALVVQSHTATSGTSTSLSKTPTLDDFASCATVTGEQLKAMSEADVVDVAGEEPVTKQDPMALPSSQLADEPQEITPPVATESHEDAAQRIDQWFRSAKTLSDVPILDASDLAGQASNEMLEPTNDTSGDAPIDLGLDDAKPTKAVPRVQLDETLVLPDVAAPWDDSQHMDRLLADLEGQPVDTYEPAVHEAAAAVQDEQEHFEQTAAWTPDESLAIPTSTGAPERKRSVVRTLVMSAVGGIVGLGFGYYALLWLGPVLNRGKEIDFLELAHFLPNSMLPSALRTDVKPVSDLPPSNTSTDLASSEKVDKTEQAMPADPVAPPASVGSAAQTPAAPDKKRATFTAPAEPVKKPVDPDDRYAIPATKSESAMREPAPLDAPSAKAITEGIAKTEPVRIHNAPSFTASDVTTSHAAADAAQAGLVTGNLQDGKEVARTKGASYITIADFAGKATFAASANATEAQMQADEFFLKLLSNTHARNEVAQIAPRWMSHPKRPQNGVFFAGSVKHIDIPGSVIEYTVELSGGPSVVVVVPVTDRSESIGGPKGPIAVFGSIIDKPSSDIPGYTGKAPQVVFAKKLIPLE